MVISLKRKQGAKKGQEREEEDSTFHPTNGDPEAYPRSSEDQAFYFLERQVEEDSPPFAASQHNVDGGEPRLNSSTYSYIDTPNPDQLPGLVFHEYTNATTEQIGSNLNNAEFTAQDSYASYGDRYKLRLPACVLKRDDAELVRHFFSAFSDSFDFGDPDRPFSSWISNRVLQYPRLLESILMIASKHLVKGRMTTACLESAAELSSDYTQRLPSTRSGIDYSMEEINSVVDLLSRFAQSMEVRKADSSVSSPSLGQANVMHEPTEISKHESLPEAAWWANLRLEAYLAIVNQEPLPSYLDTKCADKEGAPVDDQDWANLMLLHLTNVIRYCFSDNKDADHYGALLRDITTWLKQSQIPSILYTDAITLRNKYFQIYGYIASQWRLVCNTTISAECFSCLTIRVFLRSG
ncbi:ARCA-like protein [Fusarium coicis]|nr:ARCA-like protein [Fusarium coicis]